MDKLQAFAPFLGDWVAEFRNEIGPARCERSLKPILNGRYIQLTAQWQIGPTQTYEEQCVIGNTPVRFWSFTSDGQRSEGTIADVTDLDPTAVGFEAEMPAGRARFAYWLQEGGFRFVVEAKTPNGWSRFVDHHYRASSLATSEAT